MAGFLSHLAKDRQVAAATQNQALNALVFLYGEVLHQPLGDLGEWARAERPKCLPVVLTREEVQRILDAVEPEMRLPLQLLYGSGLRLIELLRLRVKDVHLEQRFLIGPQDVATTQIYTHVQNRPGIGVRSPLD